MAGPLPEHRTPNRPLFDEDGRPVWKRDRHGVIQLKYVTRPGGSYKDGRCVEYVCGTEFVQRHVLDHTPQRHHPSKNARGRTRPRTRAEQTRVSGLQARMTQLSKSYTIDANRLAAALG